MGKVTNKSAIRRNNLAGMLTEIHFGGTVSRAYLGDVLGLSKTAVADLVSELESLGLISRLGNEVSGNAGRPSQLVQPNRSHLALVINPEKDGINLALCNFAAEIVDQKYVAMYSAYSVETLTSISKEYFDGINHELRLLVRGVAVALPGAVDGESSKLLSAPSLNWLDVDVRSIIESSLGLPTWVRNNARSATVAEHLYGSARGCQNFVYLFSGVGGIGGGFVVDNRVLEGDQGLAGEIGRMRLLSQPSGTNKTFGQLMNRQDFVEALGEERLSDFELQNLITLAKSSKIQRLLDDQVNVMIAVLETLADLFDPEKIVLGGYLGTLAKCREEYMISTLNDVSFKIRKENFIVSRSVEQLEMVLIGAAELVWRQFLLNPSQANQGANSGK
jgi:predicted NBD/HSP70 family sugar kinase